MLHYQTKLLNPKNVFKALFDKNKPLIMTWEITHNCNMKCKECFMKDYEKSPEMDKQHIKKLLLIAKKKHFGIYITGGEPSITKNINYALTTAAELELKVGLNTNAIRIQNITKENLNSLKFIIISYDPMHKLNKEMLKAKLQYLKSIGYKNTLVLNYTIQDELLIGLPELMLICKEFNAQVIVQHLRSNKNLDFEVLIRNLKALKVKNELPNLSNSGKKVWYGSRNIYVWNKVFVCDKANRIIRILPSGDQIYCENKREIIGNIFNLLKTRKIGLSEECIQCCKIREGRI